MIKWFSIFISVFWPEDSCCSWIERLNSEQRVSGLFNVVFTEDSSHEDWDKILAREPSEGEIANEVVSNASNEEASMESDILPGNSYVFVKPLHSDLLGQSLDVSACTVTITVDLEALGRGNRAEGKAKCNDGCRSHIY